MSTTDQQQSYKYMVDLLRLMVTKSGSDLFIANDFPPSMKIDGKLQQIANQRLSGQYTKAFAYSLMTEKQIREFEDTKECNFAINPDGIGRFRVNVYYQQEHVSMVCRTIPAKIPTVEEMGLPAMVSRCSFIFSSSATAQARSLCASLSSSLW